MRQHEDTGALQMYIGEGLGFMLWWLPLAKQWLLVEILCWWGESAPSLRLCSTRGNLPCLLHGINSWFFVVVVFSLIIVKQVTLLVGLCSVFSFSLISHLGTYCGTIAYTSAFQAAVWPKHLLTRHYSLYHGQFVPGSAVDAPDTLHASRSCRSACV